MYRGEVRKKVTIILVELLIFALAQSGLVTNVKEVEAIGSGEYIEFGSYWQDDTNGDGKADEKDNKTPIKWRILKKNSDGTAIVYSDKVLDTNYYHESGEEVTWETCSLRKWLNEYFYNNAFTSDEKGAIKTNTVDNRSKYGSFGGNDTNDNVFLLSEKEVEEMSEKAMQSEASLFALYKGVYNSDQGNGVRIGYWWLRSTGYKKYTKGESKEVVYEPNYKWAVRVLPGGSIWANEPVNRAGRVSGMDIPRTGVRPALRVNLSSSQIKFGKDAPESNSDNSNGKSDKNNSGKSNEWYQGKWYEADGSQSYKYTLSWKSDTTGWWVEDTSGWYPKDSWQKIDGIWYYFKPDGYMASNEYYKSYWFNKDGSWDDKYLLNWKSNSTGWWVEDKSGWWPSSSWLKIDGCWYYFDSSGYMVTSQYVDGYWIGADGVCW